MKQIEIARLGLPVAENVSLVLDIISKGQTMTSINTLIKKLANTKPDTP